jgi:hypothetical protein
LSRWKRFCRPPSRRTDVAARVMCPHLVVGIAPSGLGAPSGTTTDWPDGPSFGFTTMRRRRRATRASSIRLDSRASLPARSSVHCALFVDGRGLSSDARGWGSECAPVVIVRGRPFSHLWSRRPSVPILLLSVGDRPDSDAQTARHCLSLLDDAPAGRSWRVLAWFAVSRGLSTRPVRLD